MTNIRLAILLTAGIAVLLYWLVADIDPSLSIITLIPFVMLMVSTLNDAKRARPTLVTGLVAVFGLVSLTCYALSEPDEFAGLIFVPSVILQTLIACVIGAIALLVSDPLPEPVFLRCTKCGVRFETVSDEPLCPKCRSEQEHTEAMEAANHLRERYGQLPEV